MARLELYAGKHAVVTGAASGIGRALALALSRRGASLTLLDLQREPLQALAEQIKGSGGSAEAITADVSNREEIQAAITGAVQRAGRLDYLFNNAGIGVTGRLEEFQGDDWTRIIDVNFKGVVNGIAAGYPIMRQQGFGHIINTGSIAGLTIIPGMTLYGATKHAVVALSRAMRIEAERFGVMVTVVCPGAIATPILDGGGAFGRHHGHSVEALRDVTKSWRPVQPERLAEHVLKHVAKNTPIIVYPHHYRVLWWMARFLPVNIDFAVIRFLYARNEKLLDSAEARHKATANARAIS